MGNFTRLTLHENTAEDSDANLCKDSYGHKTIKFVERSIL